MLGAVVANTLAVYLREQLIQRLFKISQCLVRLADKQRARLVAVLLDMTQHQQLRGGGLPATTATGKHEVPCVGHCEHGLLVFRGDDVSHLLSPSSVGFGAGSARMSIMRRYASGD